MNYVWNEQGKQHTCFKDDVINKWSVTELQAGSDLAGTVTTGHFHPPHHWLLTVEDMDETTVQDNVVTEFVSVKKNQGSKYFFILLAEIADECRFNLQLEFMLLIIRVCFIVLQTRSMGDKFILFDCKSTFWIAHDKKIIFTQKRNVFTV